jgi:hypothetical protein
LDEAVAHFFGDDVAAEDLAPATEGFTPALFDRWMTGMFHLRAATKWPDS